MSYLLLIFLFLSSSLFAQSSGDDVFILGTLSVTGSSLFPDERLESMFSLRSGDTLRESLVEEDIQRIIRLYSEGGYPLVKVVTESILPRDSNIIDIIFRIEENQQPRVVAMNVDGLTSTDLNIVSREFSINTSPQYSPKSITAATNRVRRLGIFSYVSEPSLIKQTDSTVGLSLRVTEGNTTFVDGVIGYGPSSGLSEKPIISGFLTLDFRNIAGTARMARFRYSREDQSRQQLDLFYKEPWLFNYPISLEARFGTRDEDSIFSRINTTLTTGVSINDITTISGIVGYESLTPGASKQVYATTALQTGLIIDVDTRNDLYYPTKGIQVKLDGIYHAKSISGINVYDSLGEVSTAVINGKLQGSAYIPTFSQALILVSKVVAITVDGGNGKLQQNDLYRIGGVQTLRGYYESEFLASLSIIGTLEYRLMLTPATFVSFFSDFGYIEREEGIGFTSLTYYPVSYGIGLSFRKNIGTLQASIALPKSGEIGNAKLHFGLSAGF